MGNMSFSYRQIPKLAVSRSGRNDIAATLRFIFQISLRSLRKRSVRREKPA